MHKSALFLTTSLWSFRKELSVVASAFALILVMPIIAVIILTQTGLQIISDTLAQVDPVTKVIQIFNPSDGTLFTEITAEITWPAAGVITLEFAKSSIYQAFHTGLDIANPEGKVGDPIYAFMEGTVIYEGEISWGYGKHVIIDHGDNITSVYAHLHSIQVFTGQRVLSGQAIGRMGNTGWSTGPHLHFETRVFGIPVNPRIFLDVD